MTDVLLAAAVALAGSLLVGWVYSLCPEDRSPEELRAEIRGENIERIHRTWLR